MVKFTQDSASLTVHGVLICATDSVKINTRVMIY